MPDEEKSGMTHLLKLDLANLKKTSHSRSTQSTVSYDTSGFFLLEVVADVRVSAAEGPSLEIPADTRIAIHSNTKYASFTSKNCIIDASFAFLLRLGGSTHFRSFWRIDQKSALMADRIFSDVGLWTSD